MKPYYFQEQIETMDRATLEKKPKRKTCLASKALLRKR